MAKIILRSSEARSKILTGLNLVADTIAVTAGPLGRNIILQQKNQLTPLIVNDGVTIAKDINLVDPIENIGASMIKQVAEATNTDAGDGTTTAIILTQTIINQSFKLIEKGVDPIALKDAIQTLSNVAIEKLTQLSRPLTTNQEIVAVAKIASNNPKIAKLIGKAYETVSNDGIIKIEDSQTFNSHLEVGEGFEFNGGYLSRYMLDDLTKPEINWHHVKVLVFNEKLNSLKAIVKILEAANQNKTPLVLIAQNFSDEIISLLAINKLKKILNVIAIKPKNYFSNTNALLEDLAIVINQKSYYSESQLNQLTWDDLAVVQQIKINQDKTTIIHQLEDKTNFNHYLDQLKSQKDQYQLKDVEYNNLENRIAALEAKIALIKIGGQTEIEQQEKKYRIEDALNATAHAVKHGIIPGAGMGLYYVAESLVKEYADQANFQDGLAVITDALKAPAQQILKNASIDPYFLKQLYSPANDQYFDVFNKSWNNAWEQLIIDPLVAAKTALAKAISVATTLITTEAVIVELIEKQRFVFPDIKS